MSLATISLDQILKTPFPSYHNPLELARSLTRSGNEEDRHKAVALLDGLRQRDPHVLAIGQELVLALEECHEPDRAEQMLKTLEKSFLNLDEEFLCRWGRLFKDRGDEYTPLPWSKSDGRVPDPVLAEAFYRKSLAKYDQAYRIRFGHYPGINKATLLLILGSLTPAPPGAPVREEVLESTELAGKLLADRLHWPIDQPDDLTVWHPATAGEAHLLRREWAQAANQYREALEGKNVTSHARESMRRQVERILMCFRNLNVSPSVPFDDPMALLDIGTQQSTVSSTLRTSRDSWQRTKCRTETQMVPRNLHIVHLLIRQNLPGGQVGFLVFPHEHWENGKRANRSWPCQRKRRSPIRSIRSSRGLRSRRSSTGSCTRSWVSNPTCMPSNRSWNRPSSRCRRRAIRN